MPGGTMKKRVARIRKYVGWFCSTFGFGLIVLGLIIYLKGPDEAGSVVWEYKSSGTRYVRPNKFVSVPYQRFLIEAPSLIPRVQTNATIAVEESQGIKAYFMNETQYSQLRNDTGFSEEIEELTVNLNNISFEPHSNVTYYIVLANIANETATASLYISTFYTCQAFYFDYAFNGFKSALIGGAMFAASFVLENPFDKLIRKGLRSPIFPGVKGYLSEKEANITIAWVGLSIITLLTLCALFPILNQVSVSELPPPLILLAQDTIIRMGLFVFFASTLVIAIYVTVVHFVYNVLRNFLYWFFGARHHRLYDIELAERSYSFWLKELASPLSLVVYSLIVILSFGIWQYTSDLLILLITVLVPLTLLLAFNIHVSLCRTCMDKEKLEQMRFFDYVDIVTGVLTSILFIVSWFFSFDLFLDRIFAETIGSSVLVLLAPPLSEELVVLASGIVSYFNTIESGVIMLVTGVMVGAFSLFLFLGYFHYSFKTHEAKRKTLLKEIIIFFSTFISVQLILLIAKQGLEVATVTSIMMALSSSFLSFFMRMSWRKIIVAPRLCSNCKKDLSTYPEDISHCPHCGEELGSLQK